MKGGTRGRLGYAKFLGAERARRDGIMSPRAEPPLARTKGRRKEAEKGRRDNGPFKKSLNRELVSSGEGPLFSVRRRHASSRCRCPFSPGTSTVSADWLNSLERKLAGVYLGVNIRQQGNFLLSFNNLTNAILVLRSITQSIVI